MRVVGIVVGDGDGDAACPPHYETREERKKAVTSGLSHCRQDCTSGIGSDVVWVLRALARGSNPQRPSGSVQSPAHVSRSGCSRAYSSTGRSMSAESQTACATALILDRVNAAAGGPTRRHSPTRVHTRDRSRELSVICGGNHRFR